MNTRLPTLRGADGLLVWAADLVRTLEHALVILSRTKQTRGDIMYLRPIAKADLPPAADHYSPQGAGCVLVTDDVDGPVPAFSDGTDWRRCTDRAVIS